MLVRKDKLFFTGGVMSVHLIETLFSKSAQFSLMLIILFATLGATSAGANPVGNEEEWVDIEGQEVPAEVSPDGEKLLFTRRVGRRQQVFVADRDGSNPKQLTEGGIVDRPCWSPGGERIVFCSLTDRPCQIFEMDADGKNLKQLTKEPNGARRPAYSTTGWFSYQRMHPFAGKSPPGDLVLTKDSEQVVVIEKEDFTDYRWSDDGKTICVGTVAKLHFYDLDKRKLTTTDLSEKDERLSLHSLREIVWNPNGTEVACRIEFYGGRELGRGNLDESHMIGDKEVFIVGVGGAFEVIPEKEISTRKEVYLKRNFSEAKLKNEKVREIWSRIGMNRSILRSVNPPATNEEINQLGLDLGLEIPDQLRFSLLTHNGSKKKGSGMAVSDNQKYAFMNIEAIKRHWLEDRRYQKEAEAEGDDYPKKPEWIPVFVDSIEQEEQIYIDTKDGSIVHYNLPASQEVDPFRYPDYATFLSVLEHHLRNDLMFEWGNDQTAKHPDPLAALTLSEDGIDQLQVADKQDVSVKFPNGDIVAIDKSEGNVLVNSFLDCMRPVQFTRRPAVQEPEYELTFRIDSESYRIAIRKNELDAERNLLDYSISGPNEVDTQNSGGDSDRLMEVLNGIKR